LDLQKQGLKPQQVIADASKGFSKGQNLAWPDIPCNGDIFHALHLLTKLTSKLDRCAYKAIANLSNLEIEMEKRKKKVRVRNYLGNGPLPESLRTNLYRSQMRLELYLIGGIMIFLLFLDHKQRFEMNFIIFFLISLRNLNLCQDILSPSEQLY
jgi:hypothetical protein